jgi:hypothetical protein
MVALLVNSSYVPGSVRYTHPALDPGVVGWTEYPPVRPDMPVKFCDYSWGVKLAEDRFDPGPNYFSADTNNIWVNTNGLHLRIFYQNGKWTCSEVYLLQSLGYGIYTFQTTSRLDSLDPRSIFSMFLYETTSREIDIEFSQALANPHNAQYVVQPYSNPGNIIRFDMSSYHNTSHRIEWRADYIFWCRHSAARSRTFAIQPLAIRRQPACNRYWR